MHPSDAVLWVVLAIAAIAVVWLIANTQRKSSGAADFIATWAATWLLAFLVGGGLMMFGVVVLYFVFGQQAALIGLGVLIVVLVLEPFIVAAVLYRRRRAVAH